MSTATMEVENPLTISREIVGPEADIVGDIEIRAEDLAEFLADPIGFGEYDYDDPITLDEFVTTTHMHGFYAAPVVG